MASGLDIPVGVDASGRMRIVRGPEQLRKIILLGLTDGSSANPFHDLGIGQEVVFSNPDKARAIATHKIKRFFAQLQAERRASLKPGYPRFIENPNTGELECLVVYVDLETDRPGDPISLKVSLGAGSAPRLDVRI